MLAFKRQTCAVPSTEIFAKKKAFTAATQGVTTHSLRVDRTESLSTNTPVTDLAYWGETMSFSDGGVPVVVNASTTMPSTKLLLGGIGVSSPMPAFHNLPNTANEPYDDAKTAEYAVAVWLARHRGDDGSIQNQKQKLVLTDIDGVLTEYCCGDAPTFGATNALVFGSNGTYAEATPRAGAVDLLQAYARKGYGIVYFCARPESLRSATQAWLTTHGFPAPARPLLMSPVEIPLPNLEDATMLATAAAEAGDKMGSFWHDNAERIIRGWLTDGTSIRGGTVAYAYGDAAFETAAFRQYAAVGAVRICVDGVNGIACDSSSTRPRSNSGERVDAVLSGSFYKWTDTYVAAAPLADALQ